MLIKIERLIENFVFPHFLCLFTSENLFICDERLEWLRSFLRRNSDLVIDAPGHEPSRCWKPSQLYGVELRKPSPVVKAIPPSSTVLPSTPKATVIRPAIPEYKGVIIPEPTETKGVQETKKDEKKTTEKIDYLQSLTNDKKPEKQLSGMNLAAMILGKYGETNLTLVERKLISR